MGLARQVLMYLKVTVNDNRIFRPAGCDGFTKADVSLLYFSDSDWACAVDTRRSHGCHCSCLEEQPSRGAANRKDLSC